MYTTQGIALLSIVRRLGSSKLLNELPEEIFIEEDEKVVYRFMRSFVSEHRAFPDRQVIINNCGMETVATTQPLSYYIDEAKRQAVYSHATRELEILRSAFVGHNTVDIIASATRMAALDRQFTLHQQHATFSDVLDLVVEDYHSAKWAGGLRGVDTGYSWLNEATAGGWQGTDNVALAGRIGDGKTYLVLKHAYSAWLAGKVVLLLSMEMGMIQMARRIIGLHTHINPRDIIRGRVGTIPETRMLEGIQIMKQGVPFHILAGNFVSSTVTLRALCDEYAPDLIIVDASYLLNPEKRGSSRRENLVDVANDLKTLSLDHNRPLIHTVQFNRQAIKDTRRTRGHNGGPALDDEQSNQAETDPVAHLGLHKIAETDAVAANASIVLALSKLPNRDDRRYYVILKGREGERGLWQINYRFDTMNFERVTQEQEDNEQLAEVGFMI